MAGEWRFNPSVHRAKDNRLVCVRVLPVCDNGILRVIYGHAETIVYISQFFKASECFDVLPYTYFFIVKLYISKQAPS